MWIQATEYRMAQGGKKMSLSKKDQSQLQKSMPQSFLVFQNPTIHLPYNHLSIELIFSYSFKSNYFNYRYFYSAHSK